MILDIIKKLGAISLNVIYIINNMNINNNESIEEIIRIVKNSNRKVNRNTEVISWVVIGTIINLISTLIIILYI
jgi:hypothetical protein